MKKFSAIGIGLFLFLNSIGQEVTIGFRNNTDFNIQIFSEDVSVPTNDQNSFELKDQSIPFYSNTQNIGSFNINDAALDDTLYVFQTYVFNSVDTFFIDFTFLFSQQDRTFRVASSGKTHQLAMMSLSDSISTSVNFTFDNTEVVFKAAQTGANKFLFLLQDTDQAQLEAADLEDPNKINVLSYNIFMLPPPIYYSNQWVRARSIPDEIRGYDVVIFQEAFMEGINQNILFDLLAIEYPYRTTQISQIGKPEDAGVYILSKWP